MSDTLSHEEIALLLAAHKYKKAAAARREAFADPDVARSMRARVLDDEASGALHALGQAALALPDKSPNDVTP